MISSILLAAGLSLRMNGENKLTKEIKGIPLINYTIKNILGSSVNEIIIVLGHEKEVLENLIENNKKIKLIYNINYRNGIASSIKTGLKNISKNAEAFFISLGDMPNVNQNIYNKLIKARYNYNKKLNRKHKKDIIIPHYEDVKGNPILFSALMKNQIMSIQGDDGAKIIIDSNKNKILNVKINNKSIIEDFDTHENFENL